MIIPRKFREQLNGIYGNAMLLSQKTSFLNLVQLENNQILKDHPLYRMFLSYLRSYNNKLNNQVQVCATEEQLHEFLYSTLLVCCSKTKQEAQKYLIEVNKWYQSYSKRRSLIIQYRQKRKTINYEADLIRCTYKSNLPDNLQQFERGVFGRTIKHKTKTSLHQLNKRLQCEEKQPHKTNMRKGKMEIFRLKRGIENQQSNKSLKFILKNQTRQQTKKCTKFQDFNSSKGLDFNIKELKKTKRFQETTQENTEQSILNKAEGSTLMRNPFQLIKVNTKKKNR